VIHVGKGLNCFK